MNKKIIAVTGGSGTIGFALTKSLLRDGHKVISVNLNVGKLKKLKHPSRSLYVVKANLVKENEIRKFISSSIRKFHKIDALVHCAYPKTKDWGTKFEKIKQKSLNQNLVSQLGSSIMISKIIINYFLKQKFGNLILISSIMGIIT